MINILLIKNFQVISQQLDGLNLPILRKFSATVGKTSEYFRANSNKILNALRRKSSSGLISVVQSFTPNVPKSWQHKTFA